MSTAQATEFDFDSLSESQIAALGNVAFGGRGQGLFQQTVRSLLNRELITAVARDELGFRWTEYDMPQAVHIAFCAWCAEREGELVP